ncbi:DUF4097 family beta strand repeat-containing protein [Nonomuraea sp. NPDC050536]|uniref:DUF4097 family beta strand repeat-containing protein n=1 Tax=Nonomuraea sp. NPDC050536 TaxID=3364366 RepID=UPI0037C6F00A
MRPLWLAAGTVCTIAALLFATGGLWTLFVEARPPIEYTSRSIPFSGKKLVVEVAQGNVSLNVETGEAGVVDVYRMLQWSQDKPLVKEDWDGHTLRLSATCSGDDHPDRTVCTADYRVVVPAEAEVEAKTTNGVLNASHLHGTVRLTSVSGDITAAGIAGNVVIRSGSGNITADKLESHQVDAETGSGNLRLWLTTRPTLLRAVARVSGDIDAWVPKGAYDVTTAARWSRVDVDRDPASPSKITLSAPEGAISLDDR